MLQTTELIPVAGLPVGADFWETFLLRVQAEPVLGWCFVLFWVAVLHTFYAPKFHHLAERVGARWKMLGRALTVFGEVEFVFILWAIPLFFLLWGRGGFAGTIGYLGGGISYTEPLFVMVVVALCSTRPILYLAEKVLGLFAWAFGGGVRGWWLSLLFVGPLLGSLITEAAAMTITALLLAKKFYAAGPSKRFAYATLGLLFVGVSVGGVLTNFAAPAVVMVAGKWGLDAAYMFGSFGWRVLCAVGLSVAFYAFVFRRELRELKLPESAEPIQPVPAWIIGVNIVFVVWAVLTAHHAPLLAFVLLVALWFETVTREHQDPLRLFDALKVGVFLAGLVIFCGLQRWWVEPLLQGLSADALYGVATILASFNDNAAVTYLVSLVPGLTAGMKFAAVAGAVTGGGLTLIANAPNPVGFAFVRKYFRGEVVNALGLFSAALLPTLIVAAFFLR